MKAFEQIRTMVDREDHQSPWQRDRGIWRYNDGGRRDAGFKGDAVGDCVTRAIAIASNGLVARVSKHLCAVKNGVVLDTHDPTRGGTRCVYGYFELGPLR